MKEKLDKQAESQEFMHSDVQVELWETADH